MMVVLSFEQRSSPSAFGQDLSAIDNVSVDDAAIPEYVTNGDFETGDLSGWTTNTPVEPQNMTSGMRTLEGLDVTRSFYTVPNKRWGRWVDVFENNTGSAIVKTITYATDLGSDDCGIIYLTPGTASMALTTWDGDNSDRDVGFVFGAADTVSFLSDDGLCNSNGSEIITFTYDITVPASGRVTIVNFIIMTGTDTADTATDITALATEVDAVALAIVTNFFPDGQYWTGMTQPQIDSVVNF